MPTPVMSQAADIQERERRALEFRNFRRDFLCTQVKLAELLKCSRRALVEIEAGRTTRPRASLLKRFRDLKRRSEKELAA